MILNWLTTLGLQRYGFESESNDLRTESLNLLRTQGLREYYDPRDGAGLGGAGFAWTAGLALDFLDMSASAPLG